MMFSFDYSAHAVQSARRQEKIDTRPRAGNYYSMPRRQPRIHSPKEFQNHCFTWVAYPHPAAREFSLPLLLDQRTFLSGKSTITITVYRSLSSHPQTLCVSCIHHRRIFANVMHTDVICPALVKRREFVVNFYTSSRGNMYHRPHVGNHQV